MRFTPLFIEALNSFKKWSASCGRSPPFAQRRQAELDDVEAMKQVPAELVGGDGLDDVAIGRGDEADVDAEFPAPPTA